MPFEIRGKIALVTGGASGIGLQCVQELLRHGLKGVTIADVDGIAGEKVVEQIRKEFGHNKAIFVTTDVTKMESFEVAFKKTVEYFKNIDILINSAGILNDALWDKEIAININGTLYGMLLGLENYLQRYKWGSEGVIVNISSIGGVAPLSSIPIYTATKFAVFGMSKAWGADKHYQRTKVRVVCICPGVTDTPLVNQFKGRGLGEEYEQIFYDGIKTGELPTQKVEHVGRSIMKVIENAKNGSAWVIENGQEAYQFVLPTRESFAEGNKLIR